MQIAAATSYNTVTGLRSLDTALDTSVGRPLLSNYRIEQSITLLKKMCKPIIFNMQNVSDDCAIAKKRTKLLPYLKQVQKWHGMKTSSMFFFVAASGN